MTERLNAFRAAVEARRAVKIIAGIANFDLANVLSVVKAAHAGGAHAVDVAARADIVRAVREQTDRVVFASSVDPQQLAEAVENGADAVELGNFDALYAQGQFLDAETVLGLAEETVRLIGGRALISVTVPGYLAPEHQANLAQRLQALKVDLIQTEGAVRVFGEDRVQPLEADEKLALTLANTRLLVKATDIPVMTATALTADNLQAAFEAGASVVGVGTYVNAAPEAEMLSRVEGVVRHCRELAEAVR